MSAIITSIHNCPVKSISFQNIEKCKINKNIGIEGDRVFAFSQNLDLDQSKEFENQGAGFNLKRSKTREADPI